MIEVHEMTQTILNSKIATKKNTSGMIKRISSSDAKRTLPNQLNKIAQITPMEMMHPDRKSPKQC